MQYLRFLYTKEQGYRHELGQYILSKIDITNVLPISTYKDIKSLYPREVHTVS